jgi:hypothetical protein
VVAILLTITTLLIELLFIAAEVILVISGLVQTIPGLLLSLLLAGLGLFIGNSELAFVIYVYRIASARPGEDVLFRLWPWEAWGLSEGDEKQ